MVAVRRHVVPEQAGGVMHADDPAAPPHHRIEVGEVAFRIGQAVRRERVADEDDAAGQSALRLIGPPLDDVGPHVGHISRVLEAVLQEPASGRNLVGAGGMIAGADHDEDPGGVCSRQGERGPPSHEHDRQAPDMSHGRTSFSCPP